MIGIGARFSWNRHICRAIGERRKRRDKLELPITSPASDRAVGEQVRYHNSAIYDDLRFFIKVSMAIVAGVGVVYCAGCSGLANIPATKAIILVSAGLLELVVGFVLFKSVLSHQESKVKWWWSAPKKEDIPRWQETRVVPILVGTAVFLACSILLLALYLIRPGFDGGSVTRNMRTWREETVIHDKRIDPLEFQERAVRQPCFRCRG
ncbi:hypothetical protein KAH43_02555 [Candidatus Bipolaricaulota bacterium]|nr:hypothetical protein [Candidatus Bipolaricaulota bacterium]